MENKKKIKKQNILYFFLNYGLIVALSLVILFVSISNRSFLTLPNLKNILRQVSAVGILAIGVTPVIIAGHLDLSISSTVTMAGVICVSFVKYLEKDLLGIFLSIMVGIFIGFLNGFIISSITSKKGRKGESFIITYGMQAVIAAAALLYTNGIYMNIEKSTVHHVFGTGVIPVFIFLILAIILEWLLKKTSFGREIYFMGSNEKAARMSGVNVKRNTILIFIISGLFASFSSLILTSRIGAASSTSGTGMELEAITAVVVGGTPLSGGKGGILKTVLGVIIMGILQNALHILNVDTYPQMIVKGLIIILAVLLDVLATKFSVIKE